MTKVTVYRSRSGICLLLLLFAVSRCAFAQYGLRLLAADRELAVLKGVLQVPVQFTDSNECKAYIRQLPARLQLQGYAAASVDLVLADSVRSEVSIYLGERYAWGTIRHAPALGSELERAGIGPFLQGGKSLDASRLSQVFDKLLSYYEENGYPFASVRFDSITMRGTVMEGSLVVDHGPYYKIDSISNLGSASLSGRFLHRYLGMMPGSAYRKSVLAGMSRKLQELPFVQEQLPWSLTRLGTGAVVNVYLEPRKSSQANVLVGLLPAVESPNNLYEPVRNRFQLTGEATIKLRNAFGSGETIGLNWQQLQRQSPRLNLLYDQPYIGGSAVGMHFLFDLFKKDTTFLNLNGVLGMTYATTPQATGSLFLQLQQSNLLSVDTLQIKEQRSLPSSADIRAVNVGVSYAYSKTDYRLNPLKGNEYQVSLSAGTRTLKKNAVISKLADENDPSFSFSSLYDSVNAKSYQFRIKGSGAHYFRLSRASTLKAALQGGWFQSPYILRNELFQIGGYRLLRGFDEESIYASAYVVNTVEYRYLVGRNSHLFVFSDQGVVRLNAQSYSRTHTYWGAGMGMMLESGTGLLNISFAVGKRNDVGLNLRQAKIHLGYVSYF